MSESNKKPTASVIRPGKAPEGPPGWEERRIEKHIEQSEEQQRKNHRREQSTGVQGIKENLHKIGEKMHLVEPKDPAQRTAAQLQVCVCVMVCRGTRLTLLFDIGRFYDARKGTDTNLSLYPAKRTMDSPHPAPCCHGLCTTSVSLIYHVCSWLLSPARSRSARREDR